MDEHQLVAPLTPPAAYGIGRARAPSLRRDHADRPAPTVMRTVLALRTSMDEAVARLGGDPFLHFPPGRQAKIRAFGVPTGRLVRPGDTLTVRWRFAPGTQVPGGRVNLRCHEVRGGVLMDVAIGVRADEPRFEWRVPAGIEVGLRPGTMLCVQVEVSDHPEINSATGRFMVSAPEGDIAPPGGRGAARSVTRHQARRGLPVVRGPDWSYGPQDGGRGAVGTITTLIRPGLVAVRWPNGHENHYCAPLLPLRSLHPPTNKRLEQRWAPAVASTSHTQGRPPTTSWRSVGSSSVARRTMSIQSFRRLATLNASRAPMWGT